MPLFRSLLKELEIDVFIMTDIDSVEDVLSDLCSGDTALESAHKAVRDHAAAKMQEYEGKVNKNFVEKLAESRDWAEVFKRLEEMWRELEENRSPNVDQKAALRRLLNKQKDPAWEAALASDNDELRKRLGTLCKQVLDRRQILLLQGKLESYYPNNGGHKVDCALSFSPAARSREDLCSYFGQLPDHDAFDVELFLKMIFAAPDGEFTP